MGDAETISRREGAAHLVRLCLELCRRAIDLLLENKDLVEDVVELVFGLRRHRRVRDAQRLHGVADGLSPGPDLLEVLSGKALDLNGIFCALAHGAQGLGERSVERLRPRPVAPVAAALFELVAVSAEERTDVFHEPTEDPALRLERLDIGAVPRNTLQDAPERVDGVHR